VRCSLPGGSRNLERRWSWLLMCATLLRPLKGAGFSAGWCNGRLPCLSVHGFQMRWHVLRAACEGSLPRHGSLPRRSTWRGRHNRSGGRRRRCTARVRRGLTRVLQQRRGRIPIAQCPEPVEWVRPQDLIGPAIQVFWLVDIVGPLSKSSCVRTVPATSVASQGDARDSSGSTQRRLLAV